MPTWTIILPRESKSGNAFAYTHWRRRTDDRDAWIVLLRINGRHVPPATGHRLVTFTGHRGRMLDDDNFSSGLKHCRDALVRVGLLLDDTQAAAKFSYVQKRRSESPRMVASRCNDRIKSLPAPCLVVTLEEP